MVNTAAWRRATLVAISIGLAAFTIVEGVASTVAQPSDEASGFERCRTIQDDAARLRCFETSGSAQGTQTPVVSGWHLVRTPNPETGHDLISIMRTADTSRSDLDLAGLMLRCGNTGTEVLLVVVQPFPPRAHPQVKLQTSSSSVKFTASIVTPGALVLLPAEASTLTQGPWQSATKLDVLITNEQDSIRGVIPLTGLRPALAVLQSSCQRQ